jgi:hypothetical protein
MIKNKTRQNFSLNKEVSQKFKKICDEKYINMSKLIEGFMKKFIEDNS